MTRPSRSAARAGLLGTSGSTPDLERFWVRRRALSFDERCRRDLTRPSPAGA